MLTYKVLFYHFTFIPNNTIGPFIVLLTVGILHLLITWIGVKGPSKEHDFFIIMFVIITIILLVVELSVGIWSLVLRSKVEERSVGLMRKSQEKYIQEYSISKEKSEWVRLQSKFECCGINGVQDYVKLPPSCFKCQSVDVLNKTRTCTETYQVGCKEPLVNYVRKLLLEVALIGFLSGILQIIGVVVFVDFYRSLREERVRRAANRSSHLRQSAARRDRSGPESGSNIDRHDTPLRLPHAPTAPST